MLVGEGSVSVEEIKVQLSRTLSLRGIKNGSLQLLRVKVLLMRI